MGERALKLERRLEPPLLIAALLTIPAIALEQSGAREPWSTVGAVLSWVTWLAFVAEMVLMLRVVESKSQWLRDHPLDVAIVILTPPVLPAALQAARVFRLLRVLRLIRAAGIARRLLSTEGVRDASVLALLTVLGGGAAFAVVEKSEQELSTWDGIWWAITTVTTVGYGDVEVMTDLGRVIAIVVMTVGIGFIAVLTAAVAERFIANQRRAVEERARLHEQLDEIVRRLDALQGPDR